MSTFLDLITGAYKLSGVVGSGETLSGSQAQDGLDALNELIDAWNADDLNVVTVTAVTCPVSAGRGNYTVGPSGDLNVPTRPPDLAGVWFRFGPGTAVDSPVALISAADYGNIRAKNVTSNLAAVGWYEPSFPIATLHLWPIPNGAGELLAHVGALLDGAVTLTGTVSLPPAYRQALRYNLACLVAVENGFEPLATVQATAVSAKKALERNNGQIVQRLSYDGMASGGRYLISSDSYR
jgi:hypothetical protein